jgi:trk system potassium uptake protein TrkA
MKILIAGAGNVGFHIAKLLVHEHHDITLIDLDDDVLNYAGLHLDVETMHGDATSIKTLRDAGTPKARLFLAVTTSEKTNIVAALLAKRLGAQQTIARIKNEEYLVEEQQQVFKSLGIDHVISTITLAAQEIYRLLKQSSFTDIFDFEKGKLSLIGITLDNTSRMVDFSLKEVQERNQYANFRSVCILRGHKSIVPNGDTVLRRRDHLYIISRKEDLDNVVEVMGKQLKKIKNVMLIGMTDTCLKTAELLEKEYNVVIVGKDRDRCKLFAETLESSLVINGNPTDTDLLKSEGLSNMDAFIALTESSETNILASLMAEECGVYKTIAMVDNVEYIHLSQNIGVDTLINRKLIAANNIFRHIRQGKIEAIASLHGVEAEVIEFIISRESKITKHPLRNLKLPKNSIIGGVIRNDRAFIPDGDCQLAKGDRVIVFAQYPDISQIERIFR